MSVVIIVLKIIGGILLFLLGFLLLALCLIFFVPVRYRVLAKLLEEQDAQFRVQVSWLLHLVSFSFVQEEGESQSSIRIFGLRLKPKKEKQRKKRAAKEDVQVSVKETETKQENEIQTDEIEQEEDFWESAKEEKTAPFAGDEPKKTERARKGAFFGRRSELGRRLKTLCGQFGMWKERLFREENKTVLLAVLTELKYLLGHCRFRKLLADIRFSAGDPAATGQALGILSMLPFLYGKQVSVFPDFKADHVYVRGEVSLKGRMRVMHFAASLMRLWKKKEVRSFIKELLR